MMEEFTYFKAAIGKPSGTRKNAATNRAFLDTYDVPGTNLDET